MADIALRLLRPLIRVSSFLAPKTSGRLAFKAFCTPPRRPQGNANRKGAVKSATTRLQASEAVSIPFPCGSVAAYVFDPPGADPVEQRPTVILVHGWTGAAVFMTAFVAPLLAAGFRVVAYDLPAHGASTGSELNIPLGVASLAAVARAFAPVHAIVTHSFGGAIALAALAGTVPGQPVVKAKRLAMIAAPSSMTLVTRRFGATIGLGARGQAALERRIHVVAGAPVTAFEGAGQLASVGLPALIVHCRDDKELGFHHAEALATAGSFARLVPMNGLGHRRILQAKPVVEAVTGFVTA
jgi:pimeloyl-ACP methyl ester carboxylesterase